MLMRWVITPIIIIIALFWKVIIAHCMLDGWSALCLHIFDQAQWWCLIAPLCTLIRFTIARNVLGNFFLQSTAYFWRSFKGQQHIDDDCWSTFRKWLPDQRVSISSRSIWLTNPMDWNIVNCTNKPHRNAFYKFIATTHTITNNRRYNLELKGLPATHKITTGRMNEWMTKPNKRSPTWRKGVDFLERTLLAFPLIHHKLISNERTLVTTFESIQVIELNFLLIEHKESRFIIPPFSRKRNKRGFSIYYLLVVVQRMVNLRTQCSLEVTTRYLWSKATFKLPTESILRDMPTNLYTEN